MKNNVKSLSIKIVSLISAFMVLFTCLIIPAAATANDTSAAYNPDIVDILALVTDYSLDVYRGGNLITTLEYKQPSVSISTAGTDVTFRFKYPYSFSCDYYIICLDSPYQPDSVVLNNSSLTLLTSSDNYYYYKVSLGVVTSTYNLKLDLPSNFTGIVSIAGFFGVTNLSYNSNSISFRLRGQYKRSNTDDGGYYFEDFINNTYGSSFSVNHEVSRAPLQTFADLTFTINSTKLDSISFTFMTCSTGSGGNLSNGIFDSIWGGATYSTGGSTQQVLPYVVSSSVANSTVNGQTQTIFTVTIDVSDIVFQPNDKVSFRCYLTPILRDSATNIYFYNFNCFGVYFKEIAYAQPWYVSFFHWIRDEFTSLKETIREAFGVGETVPDISDQQQQIQDNVSGMDQIGGEMEDSREEMEELLPEMPSWEDTGLDGFDTIVGSYIQHIELFFTAIYENVILSQILTYTFLFALGGFILFGERM